MKLRGAKFQHFAPNYHYKNVWQPIGHKLIQTQPNHPNVHKIRYTFGHREKDILWWAPDFGDFSRYPRVARTIASKRVRKAFRKALAKRGFDEDGRLLVFDSEGRVSHKLKGLMGTLNLSLRSKPLIHAKDAAIEADCGKVVDCIRDLHFPHIKYPEENVAERLKDTPRTESQILLDVSPRS